MNNIASSLSYMGFRSCMAILLGMVCIQSNAFAKLPGRVIVYPAPNGEPLNNSYRVSVKGQNVPVYNARIGAGDDTRRFKAVDDLLNSATYYDTAAFAYFDLQGQTDVTVSVPQTINDVKILPASAGVKFIKHLHSLAFSVSSPQNLTVEINGEITRSLHIFINPVDAHIPGKNDPNVIFYGPGIHRVSSIIEGDNKTIYIAGGAILRFFIAPNEKFGTEPSGLRNYNPRIILIGKHIKLCGHGIIDASECPTHSATFLFVKGSDIQLNGIIIRDSPTWTVPIHQSDNVLVNDIKILGYRANSDGIDICNSRNVTVTKSFIRSDDDLIVVKTEKNEGISNHITVDHCVLWNELAHPLSIGSEIREDVSDVSFNDCDIIHDIGREWSMRIFQSDSTTVSNIKFTNIRVEDCRRLISLWIDKNVSSESTKFGYINNVLFENVRASGSPLSIEVHGGDDAHTVSNIVFKNVYLNNDPLINNKIEKTPFYKNLSIVP